MKPVTTGTTREATMRASSTAYGRLLRRGIAVALFAAAPAVHAAPCADFLDVEDTSPFCQFVEWMKNRAVTLGCGGPNYCPDAAVNRLAMSAFMKRLGDALTPVQLAVTLSPGAIDVDNNVVVCQTADFPVSGFPRTAYADGTLSATAPADTNFALDVVVSVNGGANWTALNASANRGSVPATQWGAISDIGVRDLAVGETVRFGARVSRGGAAGTADFTESRCQVRVLVYSRTGTTSPF